LNPQPQVEPTALELAKDDDTRVAMWQAADGDQDDARGAWRTLRTKSPSSTHRNGGKMRRQGRRRYLSRPALLVGQRRRRAVSDELLERKVRHFTVPKNPRQVARRNGPRSRNLRRPVCARCQTPLPSRRLCRPCGRSRPSRLAAWFAGGACGSEAPLRSTPHRLFGG